MDKHRRHLEQPYPSCFHRTHDLRKPTNMDNSEQKQKTHNSARAEDKLVGAGEILGKNAFSFLHKAQLEELNQPLIGPYAICCELVQLVNRSGAVSVV